MSRFSPRTAALGLLFAIAPAVTALELSSVEANAVAEEPIEEAMGGIMGGLKALSKSLADPAQNEASLAALTSMQEHALAGKTLAPTNMDEIDEKDRPAHLLAYRADMTRLLRELCEMEIEVCEGKNEEAKARIRNGLIPLRNESHQKYQPE